MLAERQLPATRASKNAQVLPNRPTMALPSKFSAQKAISHQQSAFS